MKKKVLTMEKYLIGLDLGTSALKGSLLSDSGRWIAEAKEATVYEYGDKGEVTFSADGFYQIAARVIKKLVAALPAEGEIVGIGMASASGNTLLVDEDGLPLTPVFSWLDRRDAGEMEKVFGKPDEEAVYRACGWPYIPSFPLAHLAWLKVHQPELLKNAFGIRMSTDYLLFRLTGKWGMDPSTATTFYLREQVSGKWNHALLDPLGIREEQLPPVYPTGTLLGGVTPKAAEETGLPEGCAVVLGAFDHHLAALGAGVIKEGQLLLSCGTSWVCFLPLLDRERVLKENLLCDPFLSSEGGPWAGMFSLESVAVKIDGMVKKWISSDEDALKTFDALARSAAPGADGLRIDPTNDLERDLSMYEKKNIARALMEGTAYLLAEEIRRLAGEGISVSSAIMVGGPSKSDPWPGIVTDMLGIPVDTVYGVCAGAVGAATLAGIATGLYPSLEGAYAMRTPDLITRTPNPENAAFYSNFSLR